MASRDQFPEPPPLRFELTEEQVAELEKARSSAPGKMALVMGYATRHPWPEPERITLCAWFIEPGPMEAALQGAGIMAGRKRAGRKAKRGKG